jgi:uncharacterized protein
MKSIKIPCLTYELDADWYEGTKPDNILLSLIGWTSTRKRYNDIIAAIVEQTGMSALVFEYSGHGNSPFDIEKTTPAQHVLEVMTVFDQLKAKHPNAKITVMGTSYGGYMASHLFEFRDFERLILRVPAAYNPKEFYTLNKIKSTEQGNALSLAYRQNKENLVLNPQIQNLRNFKGKSLVLVHENDELVPKVTTDAYINALNSDIFIAKDIGHSFREATKSQKQEYQTKISEWLNKTS